MAVRSIKVYACDNCGLEQLAELPDGSARAGWIYGGNAQSSTRRPRVTVKEHQDTFPQFVGLFCSILCYVTYMKNVFKEKGANESPPEIAE